MNWYYVEGGQQQGPVNEAELDEKVRSGGLTPETLVWREGMANWQPYREARAGEAAPPLQMAPGTPLTGEVVCGECGNVFQADEVIRMGDRYICPNCKPVVAQKLQEGAPIGEGPVGGEVLTQAILSRGYQLDVGYCLGRGWQVLKENFWLAVGGFFLVNLVLFGASVVLGLIPFLGNVAQLILQGPLFGGLLWFYARMIRGEEIGIGDAFSGFGPRFVPLMLVHIVASIFYLLCYVPAVICVTIPLVQAGLFSPGADPEAVVREVFQTLNPLLLAGLGLGFLGFLVQIYLYVSWAFALPLAADRELGFWEALRTSWRVVGMHWWLFFVLVALVYMLLAILGFVACCVGLLVTMPWFFLSLMVAYDDICGSGASRL